LKDFFNSHRRLHSNIDSFRSTSNLSVCDWIATERLSRNKWAAKTATSDGTHLREYNDEGALIKRGCYIPISFGE
jgi:hypothetical protein